LPAAGSQSRLVGPGGESLAAGSFKIRTGAKTIGVLLPLVIPAIIGQISRKAVERVTTLAEDAEASPRGSPRKLVCAVLTFRF